MIVLSTSTSNQTFNFIPRKSQYNTMLITDEIQNETITVPIVSSAAYGYTNSITAAFTLKEDRSYMLTLKQGNEIIYRDKIYCTDQSVINYTINEGQYVSQTSNNEFIVI
jgi:hypothetical protein